VTDLPRFHTVGRAWPVEPAMPRIYRSCRATEIRPFTLSNVMT